MTNEHRGSHARGDKLYPAYALPAVRAQAHHCLSASTRIRQLLHAVGRLLPLQETPGLPATALVHKLGPASELELLKLADNDGPPANGDLPGAEAFLDAITDNGKKLN